MGIFSNAPDNQQAQDPFNDSINLVTSSEKRLMTLQKRSEKIDKDIVIRNNDLEDKEKNIKERMHGLGEDIKNIKKEVTKINQNIRSVIGFIRHLGHVSEQNRLNEKIKDMNFDDLVKNQDVEEIIEDIIREKGKT